MHAAPSPGDKPPAALGVRGLALSRGGREVCTRLTFTVAAGERLEITGANGVGKTSLLRVLAGISAADAGEVLWRGRIRDDSDARYLSELTYIAHRTGFKPELSARENLCFYAALKSAAGDARANGNDDAVAAALARFGLADFADAPCAALSEGQRRRAALARLAVERTAVWLLDEPAAALDREGMATLGALLAEHAARGGVAVVATHQPLAEAGRVRRLELPADDGGAPC